MIDINEVLRLANEGEQREAEKEIAKFFDIKCGFKCKCGDISSGMDNVTQCPKCNCYKKEWVVYQGDDFKNNLKELYNYVFSGVE